MGSGFPLKAARRITLWILGTVLFCELALRILIPFFPSASRLLDPSSQRFSRWLKDNSGIWRPDPSYIEHDDLGFRNSAVPKRAKIAAVGDSQTYGSELPPQRAWPQQLRRLSGWTTYNMGVPGYGPSEELFVTEQAMALEPEFVIAAVFPANDLWDCFFHVYTFEEAAFLRNGDPSVIGTIERLQRRKRYKTLLKENDHQGKIKSGRKKRKKYRRVGGAAGVRPEEAEEPSGFSFKGRLRSVSKLYRLAGALKLAWVTERQRRRKLTDWDAVKEAVRTCRQPDKLYVFESGGVRAVFTSHLNLVRMDIGDPRILEGFRIMLDCLERSDALVREGGAGFLVLLLPSKELTYKDAVFRSGSEAPEVYRHVIEREEKIRGRIMQYLGEKGIAFLDALPALKQSLAAGDPPFFPSDSNHLNETGQEAAARLVMSDLRRRLK